MFVKNRLRMNDETGQGNELESLKYVLNEYVSIDNLKARINTIDSNALNYYKNNKVAFCNSYFILLNILQYSINFSAFNAITFTQHNYSFSNTSMFLIKIITRE